MSCDACDGTGCPCLRARDWQSMELGCDCGCDECGLSAKDDDSVLERDPTGSA